MIQGKYGHKKQAWKGHHSEKNSSRPEQTGDEENHGSNEHREDAHEEEVCIVHLFFTISSIL